MKSMKRVLGALTILMLSSGVATISTACGDPDSGPTAKTKLDNIDLVDDGVFADNPKALTEEDVSILIGTIEVSLLGKIQKAVPKAKPGHDYTTDIKEIIKVGADVSASDGVSIKVSAAKDSTLLEGSKTFKVIVNQVS